MENVKKMDKKDSMSKPAGAKSSGTLKVNGRKLQGKVVSLSSEKTVSVLVKRKKMHPRYKKQMTWSKKYLVHDEKSLAKLNDKVEIGEGKPVSKRKSFYLLKVM